MHSARGWLSLLVRFGIFEHVQDMPVLLSPQLPPTLPQPTYGRIRPRVHLLHLPQPKSLKFDFRRGLPCRVQLSCN